MHNPESTKALTAHHTDRSMVTSDRAIHSES
jgi:hypothetical protein